MNNAALSQNRQPTAAQVSAVYDYLNQNPEIKRDYLDYKPVMIPNLGKIQKNPGERTAAQVLRDAATTALKGFADIPAAAIGLADMATPGDLTGALEKVGIAPAKWSQKLDDEYSDVLRAKQSRFNAAEGFTGKAAAMGQNPELIGHLLLQSAPQMVAASAFPRNMP